MTFKPNFATKNQAPSQVRTLSAKKIKDLAAHQHARNLVELKLLLDEFSDGANLARSCSLPPFRDGGQDAE